MKSPKFEHRNPFNYTHHTPCAMRRAHPKNNNAMKRHKNVVFEISSLSPPTQSMVSLSIVHHLSPGPMGRV